MARVKPNQVIRTLTNRHSGKLQAVGTSDIVLQLLRSMGLARNNYDQLRDSLLEFHDSGHIVVTGTRNRITCIEIVSKKSAKQVLDTKDAEDPQEITPAQDEEEEGRDMTRRTARRHGATSPSRADGTDIPHRLPDDLVGDVKIRYVDDSGQPDQDVASEVVAYAELVAEQLAAGEDRTISHDMLVGHIRKMLQESGLDANQVRLFSSRVLSCLLATRWLTPRSKHGQATTYSIPLPKAPNGQAPQESAVATDAAKPGLTVEQGLNVLSAALRTAKERLGQQERDLNEAREARANAESQAAALQERVNELQEQLREAKNATPSVDQQLLKRMADAVKQAGAKIKELEAENKAAAQEAELQAANRQTEFDQRIHTMARTHQRELAALKEEYEAQLAELKSKANAAVELDTDTLKALEELGFGIEM